jgi:hypothetical protein
MTHLQSEHGRDVAFGHAVLTAPVSANDPRLPMRLARRIWPMALLILCARVKKVLALQINLGSAHSRVRRSAK